MRAAFLIWIGAAAFLLYPGSAGMAANYYDGKTHNIDSYHMGDVWVRDTAPGHHIPTTVNILEGAIIAGEVKVWQTSRVNVRGGEIRGNFYADPISRVSISGGTTLGYLVAHNADVTISAGSFAKDVRTRYCSELIFSGGSIHGDLIAGGPYSRITVSGGSIGSDMAVVQADATVTGGSIGGDLHAEYNADVVVSGGQVAGDIVAGGGPTGEPSSITFLGSDFAIDGTSVDYGEYFATDYSSGTLTGTLASKEPLHNTFYIHEVSKIVLAVPEPATLALLALGGLALIRRKTQSAT